MDDRPVIVIVGSAEPTDEEIAAMARLLLSLDEEKHRHRIARLGDENHAVW